MPLRQVSSRVVPVAGVLALVATATLGGCAYLKASATTERLPNGTIRVTCKTSLAQCLPFAEEACNGTRFKVLAAVDQHDYIGARSTVGEQEWRASEAIIQCGRRGKSLFSGDEDNKLPPLAGSCSGASGKDAKDAKDANASKDTKEAVAAAPLCVPGATQECLGPGACRGAQACLPDHSGYSACDCGPTPMAASPSGTAGVDAGTVPATTPRPASGAPAPSPR